MERKVGVAVAVLAAAIAPVRADAQTTGTVTGQVVDRSTQQPVPDVQVFVAGTQRGGVTNRQGRFSITGVPAGAREIRARRVGYAPATTSVTVAAGQTATADFVLATAATQLQEVTVNAITGQQQRRTEGGTNTGFISVDSLPKGPITQFADVLQGKVAGVNLQSAAGSAGASQRIRIRGANSLSLSNEPLIYIDGVLSSNDKGGFGVGGQDYSRLNDLNFEDVENVEVLKGAAATAIYGSAAANGVVLITTKRGRAGRTTWSGYAETGPQNDVTRYPLNWATLQSNAGGSQPYYVDDAGDYILNTTQNLGGSAPYTFCPNFRAAIPTGQTQAGFTSCNQDVVLNFNQFRDARTTPFSTGNLTRGGLQVSGGSDVVQYFLSGDQTSENGVIRPNTVDRTSLRSSVTARLRPNAEVNVVASYVTTKNVRINGDNSIFSPLINAFLGPAQYVPGLETDSVGSPGGRVGSYFGYSTNDQRLVTVDNGVNRYVLSSSLNFTPFSWLRINGAAGLDNVNRVDEQTVDPAFNIPLSQSYILGFRANNRLAQNIYTGRLSATATATPLRGLTSNTTLGSEFLRDFSRGTFCQGVSIPSGLSSCGATATQFAVAEGYVDNRTISGFVQQQLNYADKLFLSGALRLDNNSGFVDQALFPQVQASYVASNERWFPTVAGLSLFRVRGAIGQAGNRPGYQSAFTLFSNNANVNGTSENSAITLANTGNPNLKIERTTEGEAGLDIGFGDRLTFEYTFFNRRSQDALIARPLPPSAGLSGSVFQNIGAITNRGQEFGIGFQAVRARNVTLGGRLNLTTLRNRIVTLGDDIPPIVFNRGTQAHRQGYPAGAFFGAPLVYNDADGNGRLSPSEVRIDSSRFLAGETFAYLGPALPTNTQNLSLDLTLFRNLRFSTLFERRGGNKQLDQTSYFRCRTQNSAPVYGFCDALSNPNATLQTQAAYIASQLPGFGATPSGYVVDADFIAWRELSLRYDVPLSIAQRVRLRNGLGLSVSARNLRYFTNYSGINPEINESGGSANFSQNEFNTQPPVRTIVFRVDLRP